VIDSEEVQATADQTVVESSSADVIVAQAAGASSSSAAGGAAAGGVSTTALVVAGVAVAAAAGSSSSSSTAASTPVAATTPAAPVATAPRTFTTDTEVLTGGSGDDTFIGDATDITTADQVDGGAGTDTVKIYSLAAATDLPTMTNVEVLELTDAAPAGNALNVAATGISTLRLVNATTTDNYTIGGAMAVALSNMADGETITLTSTATDTTADISVTNMGTIAGAGVTVNADGAAISTVNLTATGTVAATTDSDVTIASTGTLRTFNISGSGDVSVTTAQATVTTYNAAETTGNLTLVTGANTAATTITTGSGNDTVTATGAADYTINLGAGNDVLTTSDAAGELTLLDTINGGEGTDTLAIGEAEIDALDAGTTNSAALVARFTGFERLRVTDALDNGTTVISRLGFNYLELGADLTGDETVTGFTSGATIVFRNLANEADALIVGMTGATAAGTTTDTINIVLNADLTTNDTSYTKSLDLAGINIVNITANDRDTTTVADSDADGQEGYVIDLADGTAANSASIDKVTISGAQQVSYTVNAATTNLDEVDGSAATGNVIVNASAFAGTQGLVIKGGSGIDTLTGSTLADNISGGSGADTITGFTGTAGDAGGADVLTGGAGADTFVVGEDNLDASATNFITITDFNTGGQDVIAYLDETGATALSIVTSATASTGVAAISAEGFATFAAADDTLAEKLVAIEAGIDATADADGAFAVFVHGSDTYIYISDADATDDILLKLTGISGLTDTTINGNGDLLIA